MVKKKFWIVLLLIILCAPFVFIQATHAQSSPPSQKNQGHNNVEGIITQLTGDTISVDVGNGVVKTFTINKRELKGVKRGKIGDRVLIDLDDDRLIVDISVLPQK